MLFASAICWKCCEDKNLRHAMRPSSQAFPQQVWKSEFALRAQCGWHLRDPDLLAFLLVPLGHNLIRAAEHGTRAGPVGFADQAFALHLIEHGGGAAIAD